MRKAIALIISAVLLLSCLSVSAMAAGTDDGTLTVAEVNGNKYFGTAMGDILVKYTAADGSGDVFYDLTGDKAMNICDLVKLVVTETDLDGDGYSAADAAALRLMLIGDSNS